MASYVFCRLCSHGDVDGPHSGHVHGAVAEADEMQDRHLGAKPEIQINSCNFNFSNFAKCSPP